jgi:hypothetical protein
MSLARRPPDPDGDMVGVYVVVAFLLAYGLSLLAQAVTGIH